MERDSLFIHQWRAASREELCSLWCLALCWGSRDHGWLSGSGCWGLPECGGGRGSLRPKHRATVIHVLGLLIFSLDRREWVELFTVSLGLGHLYPSERVPPAASLYRKHMLSCICHGSLWDHHPLPETAPNTCSKLQPQPPAPSTNPTISVHRSSMSC